MLRGSVLRSQLRLIPSRIQARSISDGNDIGNSTRRTRTPMPTPIRALFYVPGSSQKMIDKAWELRVDNIVRTTINSGIDLDS